VGTLRIGDGSIQLLKYGTGETRLSAGMRADGIVRGLGGLYAGQFTSTQRDAIPSGSRPYGLVIFNTTTNRLEINLGTDATPSWSTNISGAVVSVQDEGNTLPSRQILNFVGQGVTVTDNSAQNRLEINIPGTQAYAAMDLPAGMVSPYAGSSDPSGWFICDGRALNRTSYPLLFNVIGFTYGGSGTTFYIPDLRGRVPVGLCTNPYHQALGQNEGNLQHERSSSHFHFYDQPVNPAQHGAAGAAPTSIINNQKTSGSVYNENTPAYITLNYIIRHTPFAG
jgi:microcystin-dependent protein